MERREGWLLGRGVIDDKGPAVLSLYAGAYLLRHGIVPRYTFRALLGCDEEVGMSDVHHYLENHADPDFLFTPDAEFPVCNAEKGQFGATFVSPKIDGGRIVSWSGAEASNAIPSQSICNSRLPPMSCRHRSRTPTAWRSRRSITGMRRFLPAVLAVTLDARGNDQCRRPYRGVSARGRGRVWCPWRAPADACRARVCQVFGFCACGRLWPRPGHRRDEPRVWPAHLQPRRHPCGGWPHRAGH
mgnify:CR=1 FL=1